MAILATELRIGNWVEMYHHEKPKTRVRTIVPALAIFKISIGEYNVDPIPLTPELLEKSIGKKWNDHGNVAWSDIELPEISEYCGLSTLTTKRTDLKGVYGVVYMDIGDVTVELKYLHQLQNLYFCLTGTELKVNL